MLAIAYWNIHKGKGPNIADAVIDLAVDICLDASLSGTNGELLLCLAEPGKTIDFSDLLARLKAKAPARQWWIKTPSKRFVILGTIAEDALRASSTEIGHSLPCALSRVNQGVPEYYEIWFVHLSTPTYAWFPDVVGLDEARFLRENIEKSELQSKPRGSVAIGDFNMEPFHSGMLATTGLNATPCETVASSLHKKFRTTESIQYFFNPMWKLLGSWKPNRQPGTFFRQENAHAAQWHIIDHVLLRPALVALMDGETPRILTKAGSFNLTTATGEIGPTSDHLPLVVTLKI